MMINNNTYKDQGNMNTMANNLLNLRISHELYGDVAKLSREEGYANVQDFVRTSLREKVKTLKMERIQLEIMKLKGSSKGKARPMPKEELSRLIKKEFA